MIIYYLHCGNNSIEKLINKDIVESNRRKINKNM